MSVGLHIALVGYRGSDRDSAFLDYLERTLEDELGAAALRDVRYDEIDLVEGRDFLGERSSYDVVALLNVYREVDAGNLPDAAGFLVVSREHSRAAWARRLAATRATFVYLFAGPGGIDMAWLGALRGFAGDVLTVSFPDSEIHVERYRRAKLAR